MTHDSPLALTPEQIAAVQAGKGIVYAEDPTTHRRYALVDNHVETTHTDEQLRAMLAEGIAELDRGEGIPWDIEAIKARLAERIKQDKS